MFNFDDFEGSVFDCYDRVTLNRETAVMLERSPISAHIFSSYLRSLFKFCTIEELHDDDTDSHKIEFEAFYNSDHKQSLTGKHTFQVGSIITSKKDILSSDKFNEKYVNYAWIQERSKFQCRKDLPDAYRNAVAEIFVKSRVADIEKGSDGRRLYAADCYDPNEITEECFAASDAILMMAEQLKSLRSNLAE